MIPLDMVWMDAEGKVLFVSADTPPARRTPVRATAPSPPPRCVLEIAGGKAVKEKVGVGSVLQFQDLK